MSKRIYVGNLPFSSSEGDLKRMFAAYGPVTAVSLKRGEATVEMANEVAAAKAVKALGRAELRGNRLKIQALHQ